MKKVAVSAVLGAGLILSIGSASAKAPEPDWTPVEQDQFISLTKIPDDPDPSAPLPINEEPPKRVVVQKPKSAVHVYKPPLRRVIIKGGSARSQAKKYALGRIGQVQFACLNQVWNRESHWNYRSYNHSSGAYGIPQALPGNKMASFGDDWRTNPITQVRWGLHYINGRYGSACGAWAFWRNHGWY